MGVCLYFTTEGPVDPATAAAVRESCGRVKAAGRHWILCEGPWFFPHDFEGGGRLRGRTKLNMMPHPEELAEAGPINLGDHDLGRILDALCRWSGEYALTWKLDIDGRKIGWIENGECGPALRGYMNSFAEIVAESGDARRLKRKQPRNPPGGNSTLRIWREEDE